MPSHASLLLALALAVSSAALSLDRHEDVQKSSLFGRLYAPPDVIPKYQYAEEEDPSALQDLEGPLYSLGATEHQQYQRNSQYELENHQRYEPNLHMPDHYGDVPLAENRNYDLTTSDRDRNGLTGEDDDWVLVGDPEHKNGYDSKHAGDEWSDDIAQVGSSWPQNILPPDQWPPLEEKDSIWPGHDTEDENWVVPGDVEHDTWFPDVQRQSDPFPFGQSSGRWLESEDPEPEAEGAGTNSWPGSFGGRQVEEADVAFPEETQPQTDWSKGHEKSYGKSHIRWEGAPHVMNSFDDQTDIQESSDDDGLISNPNQDVEPNSVFRENAPPTNPSDSAQKLDQIRQAFLRQSKRQPQGDAPDARFEAAVEEPRVAEVKEMPAAAPLVLRKRLSTSAAPQPRYMPWVMIASIAVGTVATVLAAIFVVRRLRGEPGKVVTQQWIPHHVLRMSTGSADIQPAGARAADGGGEPIRIKAKGLLERRCSNSSLTIHLQNSDDDGDPLVVSSPGRQCDAAEYLASAGNRLSRRELRHTEHGVAALQAEFWDIPLNFPDKCDIAGASSKNRYKTVMPNEHTRVTLPGVNEDPLTCYINANWIRGYDTEERAYIATQGPLAHTLEDFWAMVLSKRTPAIVMITKLRENGRIKCAGYLPETRQKATFGKIEVTVKRILPRNGYTLRHITVKRGKEQLQLQHFWFTAWPDHRTPEDARQLLQMAADVEAARRDDEGNPTGPVVVHCSAGIGRTGCFIAISIGTSQLMEEGGVDVLGIVCAMRQDRGGMVQTAEQYIFIHKALREFEASLPAMDAGDRKP